MSARQYTMEAFRNDPFNWPFYVVGFDLTAATVSFVVRRHPDEAGAALATASIGSGITLVEVLEDGDGVKTSLLQITIPKATIQAFPVAMELLLPVGSDLTFYYDMQWTLAASQWAPFTAVEETKLFGQFILRGSVNG